MTVIVLAELTVQQGKLDRVLEYVRALVKHAEEDEPGTMVYVWVQDPKNDHVLKVWEEYDSEEAFKQHSASQPLQTLFTEIDDLVEGGKDGVKFTSLTRVKLE